MQEASTPQVPDFETSTRKDGDLPDGKNLPSSEFRTKLESAGYIIVVNSGRTMEEINIDDGNADRLNELLDKYPELKGLKSEHPWIAINPGIVIPKSINKFFDSKSGHSTMPQQSLHAQEALDIKGEAHKVIGTLADFTVLGYEGHIYIGNPDTYAITSTITNITKDGKRVCIAIENKTPEDPDIEGPIFDYTLFNKDMYELFVSYSLIAPNKQSHSSK